MQDINNGIIKLVSSLAVKKYRDKEHLCVAEGWKCVRDTWRAFNCRYLIATKAWYEQQGTAEHYPKLVLAHKSQMARMSQFTTPSDVMAVYEIPETSYTHDEVRSGLNIVLDNIQDPGNLGTSDLPTGMAFATSLPASRRSTSTTTRWCKPPWGR